MKEVFFGVSFNDNPLLGVTLEYVGTDKINIRVIIMGARSWAVTFSRGTK